MINGISILHFEDQFMDMASLVHQLFLLVSANIREKEPVAEVAKVLKENENGLRIYEFDILHETKAFPTIRYILTDSEKMTPELEKKLLEKRVFVLDAWRETDGGTKLRCNINETFQSIEAFYSEVSDVVIYSAYPGNSERLKGRQVPMELTKSSPEDLQVYLMSHLLGCLDQ